MMHARLSHEAEACRQLWVGVVLQAARDVLDGVAAQDRPLMTLQAERWLGTADFRTVCNLAGLDPAAVQQGLRRRLEGLRAGGQKRIRGHMAGGRKA